MGLSMRAKKEVSKEFSRRYRKGSKKARGVVLNEFVELTGYNRCYASYILRNCGKRIFSRGRGGERLVVVGEFVKRRYPKSRRRKYDDDVLKILVVLWMVLNFPCWKRLKAELSGMVKKSRQFKEIKISIEVKSKLDSISAATIDRLLKPERKKYELKCRARTKPGTLLKNQNRRKDRNRLE